MIKKSLIMRFSLIIGAFLCFFALANSAFASSPTMTAETFDTDDDGTVDEIVLTFSEATDIDDTSGATDGLDSLSITNGCTIPNADYTSDGVTSLTISNLTGCTSDDTGITPTVTYTAVTDCSTNFSICDDADTNQMADGEDDVAEDKAEPVLTDVDLSLTSNLNRITFTYTENMTVTDGASTSSKGDITTAGTVEGFGDFDTTGDVTVPSTYNTVGGNGTSMITVDLAAQAGGYMETASSTEPSGDFTPIASAQLVDANSNQVNTSATAPTSTSTGWDLTKPTISSGTLDDATGDNGRVDQIVLVFNENMRDSNFTDGDGDLGGNTGTFDTDVTGNDTTMNFDVDTDNLAIDTSATAADFTYDGSTTKITDLAGNLLDVTATDGQIASGDLTEADGANPVVHAVDFATTTSGGITYNSIELTYSEPMNIYTDGAGGDQIGSGSSSASTTDMGAMTSFRDIAGLGTWNGTSNMTTNAASDNTVALDGTGEVLTVSFNTQAGSYFDSGDTGPSAGDVFTPVADVNDVEDAVGLPVNTVLTPSATVSTGWDVTPPQIDNTYSCESGAVDGDIDRIQATFNEDMHDSFFVAGNFEGDNDSTNDGFGEEVPSGYSTETGGCDGLANDTDSNDDKICFDFGTGFAGTDLAYLHHNTQGARDHAGNRLALGDALGTENDKAAPFCTAGIYTDGNTDAVVETVVLTFSENTTFTMAGADWNFGTAGDIGLSGDFAATECSGSGTTTVTCTDVGTGSIAANADMTGKQTAGGNEPVWDYTDNGNVTDGSANDTGNFSVTLGDNADPAYVSSATLDNDNNGVVDYIKVVYSEIMDDSSMDPPDFEAGVADTTAGNLTETITSGIPAGGNESDISNDTTVYVGVASSGETLAAGTTDYTLFIEQVAGGGGVDDANSNTLASFGSTASDDGAAPMIVSLTIKDPDFDGLIDIIDVLWSEDVDTDNGAAPILSDFGIITLPDGNTVSSATISDPGGTTDIINLTNVVGQVNEDTTVGSTDIDGITNEWEDTSSNLTSDPDEHETIVDAAAPYISDGNVTVTYTDNEGNPGDVNPDDIMIVTWDAASDGSTDLTAADADFSDFGGGTVIMRDDGAGCDLANGAGNDVWCADYTVLAGTIDDSDNDVVITGAVDSDTNTAGDFTDGTTFSVDNEAPTIATPGSLSITTDNNSNGVANVNDTVTYNDGIPGAADVDSWTVDLTNLTGDAAATNVGSPYTVIAGTLSGSVQFTETVTDNAGNIATGNTDALNVNNYPLLTGTGVSLSRTLINSYSLATISFTTADAWPADGKMEIIFPVQFNVSNLNGNNATDLTNVDGSISISVSGQTVTLTRDGSGTAVAGSTDVSFGLNDVVNGSTTGTTGTFSFETQNSGGGLINIDDAVPGVTLTTTTTTTGGGGGTALPPVSQSTPESEEEEIGIPGQEEAVVSPDVAGFFEDVDGHWGESYIYEAWAEDYVSGYSDDTFRPDNYINRAEAAKLIALWMNNNEEPASCEEGVFEDVSCSDWFGKFVDYLYANGVVQGLSNGMFGPGNNLTRAEALKMLLFVKNLQDTDISGMDNPFSDIVSGDWYYDIVLIGYELGIVQGYNDGTFGPDNPVTRAEFTKMFVETLLNN